MPPVLGAGHVVQVTAGTALGMLFSDVLAVRLGDKLAGREQMKWLRWIAASLFFVFGAVSLWSAIHGNQT